MHVVPSLDEGDEGSSGIVDADMGGKQSAHAARTNGGIVHAPLDAGGGGSAAARKASRVPLPMPTELGELERRFNEVLVQMDLPPERAKHLRYVR